jgi:hypothetical protein
MSDTRVTDAGGAGNFAHRTRVPGGDEVRGFNVVQRHAPSDVNTTGYFRLLTKSNRAIFSTHPTLVHGWPGLAAKILVS